MSIENNEQEVAKVTSTEEDKTASALLADVFDTNPTEMSRRHHHCIDNGPIHIDRPTSTLNAFQYTVRDGKITVTGR